MTRGADRRQSGFTLLEVLVALVVLALLMASLAQATRFGVRAWNTQSATVLRNADLDTVDRTLRTLIARMQPPAEPDQPSLQGTAHEMQFSSALPDGAGAGATRIAAIGLLVDGSRHLLLRWTPQPHAKLLGAPPPVHQDVLLDDVSGMDLSYRGRDGTWSDSWRTPTLPQLVRIHLALAGHRRWPDILVAPMRDSISETGE